MATLTLVHSAAAPAADAGMDPRHTLAANLDAVRSIVAGIARRHRLSADDQDDLSSYVMLRLLENDGAILRKFEQRSALRTYLTVVVQRLFLDFRDQAWGKWRPSSRARRHGRIGVLLESLTGKRGLSFEEACRVLRAHYQLDFETTELVKVHGSLPARPPRRFLAEEALEGVPAGGASPERRAAAAQSNSRGERICRMLSASLAEMSTDDRALLLMRYRRNLSVAAIARQLSVDQKALYRRYESLLTRLRQRLQQKGMAMSDLMDVLAETQVELQPVLGGTTTLADQPRPVVANRPVGPSVA